MHNSCSGKYITPFCIKEKVSLKTIESDNFSSTDDFEDEFKQFYEESTSKIQDKIKEVLGRDEKIEKIDLSN